MRPARKYQACHRKNPAPPFVPIYWDIQRARAVLEIQELAGQHNQEARNNLARLYRLERCGGINL